MSIGDHRRRKWIFDYFDYKNVQKLFRQNSIGENERKDYIVQNNIDDMLKTFGLVILDVKSYIYDNFIDDTKTLVYADRVHDSIVEYISKFDTNTIIVMPNQKTRNCYYRELEDTYRYDYNNISFLSCYSNFMYDLYNRLNNTYSTTSNVLITEQNMVAMDNEIIMTYAKSYSESNDDAVFIYSNSPDMCLFGCGDDVKSNLKNQIYFGYNDKIYLMKNCNNVLTLAFKESITYIKLEIIQQSALLLFGLFGNTFIPQEYSIHLYNTTTDSNVDIMNGIIKRFNNYVTSKNRLPFNITNTYIKIHEDFISNVVMSQEMYEETLDKRNDSTHLFYRIPDNNNVMGSTEQSRSSSIFSSLTLYEDTIVQLGQSLPYVIYSMFNYYNLRFSDINTNIFYDSSLYNIQYISKKYKKFNKIVKMLSNDKYLYPTIEYILRTNSSLYLKNMKKSLHESSYSVIIDNITITGNKSKNGDEILKFLYPKTITTLDSAYGIFINQNKELNNSIYCVVVPYRDIILFYIRLYRILPN